MNKIAVATFNYRVQAEPMQRRLVESGIPAEISKVTAGVRIEVPANQSERAHQLLLDCDAANGALREAIRCPECKSLRVEYPQYSRKSMLPNFIVGFWTMIGGVQKEFYCHDCHFTWPKEGTKQSRLRPHSAPCYFIEGVEQTPLAEPPEPHCKVV